MTFIRALVAAAGFLSVLLAMSLLAFGWWLTEAWPPPSRKY
jgi:uncharacterized membrane protein